MKNKRVTRVTAALNSMNKTDIYSLMLFALYKMREMPDYLALTEMAYLLDGDNLTKFLSYFGGMTITIPTMQDFRLITKALLIYQYVNIEEGSFEDAIKSIPLDEFKTDDIKQMYTKLVEVLSNYEFIR